MIPRDYITEWRARAPWVQDFQVEQDLVICRAGALTVSELATVGVGAVLVPFPAAVDDHQSANAGFLVQAGAAVLVADRELTPQRLADTLKQLCAGREPLLAMAQKARALAQPQSAQLLCDAVLRHAGEPA